MAVQWAALTPSQTVTDAVTAVSNCSKSLLLLMLLTALVALAMAIDSFAMPPLVLVLVLVPVPVPVLVPPSVPVLRACVYSGWRMCNAVLIEGSFTDSGLHSSSRFSRCCTSRSSSISFESPCCNAARENSRDSLTMPT
jgi:hypothetical protein